jgi:hypothetical protein
MEERKTISVPEAGKEYFDLGRNASYDAARRGDIPTIKLGRLLRVPVVALEGMLERTIAARPESRSAVLPSVGASQREPSTDGFRTACSRSRDDDDFYVEPSWCSERLFAVEPFTGTVWDPAPGLGTIPKAARAAGLSNFASDIADHGCGPPQDFLTTPAPTTDPFSIVCHPPFKLVRAFVERAIELGATKTAIIFPTARLNAAHWLEPLPLARVWLLTPRPSMTPGQFARGEQPGGGKTDFCWLVLTQSHQGPAMVRWLHRDNVQ